MAGQKGPVLHTVPNRAAEAEASRLSLVHRLQRVPRGEDPPASLGGVVAQLSAQRRLRLYLFHPHETA